MILGKCQMRLIFYHVYRDLAPTQAMMQIAAAGAANSAAVPSANELEDKDDPMGEPQTNGTPVPMTS